MITVQYQQITGWAHGERNDHQQGMRLECLDCGWIEYFGDSSQGDRKMAEAKVGHNCDGS